MVLSADQIFEMNDFNTIVKFAIKKYKLVNQNDNDYDDFIQELYLFMRKYPKPVNLKVTTYIVKACIWTSSAIKNLGKRRKKFKNSIELNDSLGYYTHEEYEQFDQEDHEQSILSLLTERQKDVISRKLKGKTNSEIVKEIGCSKQNVSEIISSANKTIINHKLGKTKKRKKFRKNNFC